MTDEEINQTGLLGRRLTRLAVKRSPPVRART